MAYPLKVAWTCPRCGYRNAFQPSMCYACKGDRPMPPSAPEAGVKRG